jgi:hypothetical protein
MQASKLGIKNLIASNIIFSNQLHVSNISRGRHLLNLTKEFQQIIIAIIITKSLENYIRN